MELQPSLNLVIFLLAKLLEIEDMLSQVFYGRFWDIVMTQIQFHDFKITPIIRATVDNGFENQSGCFVIQITVLELDLLQIRPDKEE